jgi:hypothetical protein
MAVLKVNQLTGLGRFRTLNRTALTPEAVHGLKLDERVRHLSSLVSGSGRGHHLMSCVGVVFRVILDVPRSPDP